MFKKNEGTIDRLSRLVLAVVLFLLAWFLVDGTKGTVLYVLAVILLFTALIGHCGLYRIFGVNTCKKREQ